MDSNNNNEQLINDVKDICNHIENPSSDVINVIVKSSEMLLRENVLKTVQDSLAVVSELDKKINSIVQIIFDRINSDQNVKMDDLFRLLNILKGYRLNSFRTVTDPLKSSISSDMDNKDGNDLDKLSNTLSSGDLKKLKNLSSNLEKFNALISLMNEEKDVNKD